MTGINRVGGLNLAPQNYVKNNFKQRAVSSPIQTEDTQKTISKKKKIGIALAIATVAAGVGAAIITRGKALKNKNLLADIPEDLQAKFANLKGLQGKEFVDKAYKEMVDYMGLSKVAPKTIEVNKSDGAFSITGGYNPVKNTIGYSEGFLTKLTKKQQINMITHELKHCEQFTNMLRTEGLTVEKYTEAIVNSTIKNVMKDPVNVLAHISYENAVKAGKGEEWMANLKANMMEKRVAEIKENFKEILEMPKIKADSPQGKKAFEDLKANENYEGIGFLGLGGKAYKSNPLEVEAYAFGDKMEELFNKYTITKG